jgi:hypothetical protein
LGEISERCIELGGAVTREHDACMFETLRMQKERATTISTMQVIRNALDLKNILGPGKLQQLNGNIMAMIRNLCKGSRTEHHPNQATARKAIDIANVTA